MMMTEKAAARSEKSDMITRLQQIITATKHNGKPASSPYKESGLPRPASVLLDMVTRIVLSPELGLASGELRPAGSLRSSGSGAAERCSCSKRERENAQICSQGLLCDRAVKKFAQNFQLFLSRV